MHCTINKKETVTKATITIALDSEEEIQAFKNVLAYAEHEIYRQLNGSYLFKLEKQILQQLKDSIR